MAIIDKPDLHFNTILWTGDDVSPRTITGVNFQPDFTWTKRRDGGDGNTNHNLYNSVVGAGNNSELNSNGTGAEGASGASEYGYISAFASDGFTLTDGTDGSYEDLYTNQSGGTYASWNWKAGTSFTNDASATGIGTIDSTGSVNTDAGFSIVSFDLTGESGVETIKHGLDTAPKVVITKRRSGGAGDWTSYFGAIGNSYLVLNSTNAGATSSSFMNNTAPTSSVFTVGDPSWWGANPFIAYCFAEKQGYSKFGSYTGNGNADGTFVYTGFKPAFVIIKRTDSAANWRLHDNKRQSYNAQEALLQPSTSDAEISDGGNYDFDMLSNGFKLRNSGSYQNASGGTFIYMAFAENPFVTSTGVPATAR